MDQARGFHQLSEAISDAAADPAGWPVFLGKFAETVGSNSISLHWETMDPARRGKIAFRYGLAAALSIEYERYYGPLNPIIAHAGALIAMGRGVLRQEACSEEVFRGSEFYNDFLKPNDFLHVLGGTVVIRGAEICMISILGSHTRNPFTLGDKRLLEALMPHMRTALVLQDRLAAAQERLVNVQMAFNMMPDAVVLIDSGAAIVAANEAARRILEARDGLYVEQDKLRIRDRNMETKFSQILKGIALAKRFGLTAAQGGAFRLLRPSGFPAWMLQVFPVEKRMAATAVVFITAGEVVRAPSESDLAALFDLSPMQSKIAMQLYNGNAPNQISEQLEVTRNTLKTHLNRLFLKLGIRRQTDLMRLLSRLKPR